MEQGERIDKWLWSVRLYKTRSQASMACRGGKVKVGEGVVKPSREIHPGDEISVNMAPLFRSVRVLGIPHSRVSAKLVPEYLADLTPPEEYEKLKIMKELHFEARPRGLGRPTKRERRDIEHLKKIWKD
jgi:ribosome-associated heat shock protein Hsp15